MDKARLGVTGITGYVGNEFFNRLKNIKKYKPFYLNRSEVKGSTKNYIPFDLTKSIEEKLPSFEAFVHIASLVPESQDSLMSYREVEFANGGGMLRLLNALNKDVLSSFINISSSHLWDPEENTLINNPYEGSKLSSELNLKAFSEYYNFNHISLRFSYVYGPFMKHGKMFDIFITRALADQDITLYNNGKDHIYLLYIDDAVDAIFEALHARSISGKFDICTMNKVTTEEIAQTIIELTNSNSKIVYKGKGSSACHQLNPSKTQKELGFKATTSLKTGIKNILNQQYA